MPAGLSIKAAQHQVIFLKAQIMAQFMQVCAAHFSAVSFFFFRCIVPDIFQEKNNLRWSRLQAASLIGKRFTYKEPQQVRIEVVVPFPGRRFGLENDGDRFCFIPQTSFSLVPPNR